MLNVLISLTGYVIYNILEILFSTPTNNILLRHPVLHLKAKTLEEGCTRMKSQDLYEEELCGEKKIKVQICPKVS